MAESIREIEAEFRALLQRTGRRWVHFAGPCGLVFVSQSGDGDRVVPAPTQEGSRG